MGHPRRLAFPPSEGGNVPEAERPLTRGGDGLRGHLHLGRIVRRWWTPTRLRMRPKPRYQVGLEPPPEAQIRILTELTCGMPPNGPGAARQSRTLVPLHADPGMNRCPRSLPALRRGGSGSRGDGVGPSNRLFDHMNNFGSGYLFPRPTSAGEELAIKLADSAPVLRSTSWYRRASY